MPQTDQGAHWLLLVYELPTQPSNARVKTWRRLQALGAVAVKDSVYVLPETPEAREDFEWMAEEIRAMKGQATLFLAENLDADARDRLVTAFRRVRQQDYVEIRRKAAALGAKSKLRSGPERRAVRALQGRLARIQEADFFEAPGRAEAIAAVEGLQRRMEPRAGTSPRRSDRGGGAMATSFRQRTWVTRPRPGIDRMSSAWLIRRFIDPKARFRFAEKPPGGKAVPFDMYGVEFGHQGQNCTFETLVARFGVADTAVKRIAQIVHDLDLKEERYGAPEGPAVGRMVEGLRQMYADDHELLEQGITMMESLYRSLSVAPAAHRARERR